MASELVNIGFHNLIAVNRVVAILPINSAPSRRMVYEAKKNGLIIDMTNGRRIKSLIVMDNEYIVLSAIAPEIITGRIVDQKIANQDIPRG